MSTKRPFHPASASPATLLRAIVILRAKGEHEQADYLESFLPPAHDPLPHLQDAPQQLPQFSSPNVPSSDTGPDQTPRPGTAPPSAPQAQGGMPGGLPSSGVPQPANSLGQGSLPPRLGKAYEIFGKPAELQEDFAHVGLTIPEPVRLRVIVLGRMIADGDLHSKGREDQPHVTALYGIHSDDPEPVIEILSRFRPVNLKLTSLSVFAGEKYDVIKIDVESDQLTRINEALRALPHTNTFRDFRPHCTIAYVKPGLGRIIALRMGDFDATCTANNAVFSSAEGVKHVYPLGRTLTVEKAAMSSVDDAKGGYLVPPPGRGRLTKLKRNSLKQLCRDALRRVQKAGDSESYFSSPNGVSLFGVNGHGAGRMERMVDAEEFVFGTKADDPAPASPPPLPAPHQWPKPVHSELIHHAGAVLDSPTDDTAMMAFADHLKDKHEGDPHADAFLGWVNGEKTWSEISGLFQGSVYHPEQGHNTEGGAPDQPYIELRPRYTTVGAGGATPRTVYDTDEPIGRLSKRVDRPEWRFYQQTGSRARRGTLAPPSSRAGESFRRDVPTPNYSHANMTSTEVAQHLHDADGLRGLILTVLAARHYHPRDIEARRDIRFKDLDLSKYTKADDNYARGLRGGPVSTAPRPYAPGASVPHTHADFLAKLNMLPYDEVPRLAYADWLRENGMPKWGDIVAPRPPSYGVHSAPIGSYHFDWLGTPAHHPMLELHQSEVTRNFATGMPEVRYSVQLHAPNDSHQHDPHVRFRQPATPEEAHALATEAGDIPGAARARAQLEARHPHLRPKSPAPVPDEPPSSPSSDEDEQYEPRATKADEPRDQYEDSPSAPLPPPPPPPAPSHGGQAFNERDHAHANFIRAITSDPHDMIARKVYADYLDEHEPDIDPKLTKTLRTHKGPIWIHHSPTGIVGGRRITWNQIRKENENYDAPDYGARQNTDHEYGLLSDPDVTPVGQPYSGPGGHYFVAEHRIGGFGGGVPDDTAEVRVYRFHPHTRGIEEHDITGYTDDDGDAHEEAHRIAREAALTPPPPAIPPAPPQPSEPPPPPPALPAGKQPPRPITTADLLRPRPRKSIDGARFTKADPAPTPKKTPFNVTGMGTPAFNPRPHPAAGNASDVLAARESDPLWQYHRGLINHRTLPHTGGLSENEASYAPRPVLASQVYKGGDPHGNDWTHTIPVGFQLGGVYDYPEKFPENPDVKLTRSDQDGRELYGAINLGHPENYLHHAAVFGASHTGGSFSHRANTRERWVDLNGPLGYLIGHAAPHDPYRLLAASVWSGNRHALAPLVELLKKRDNPMGWAGAWVGLDKAMKADIVPHSAVRRLDAIAERTQAFSEDPQGHAELHKAVSPNYAGHRVETVEASTPSNRRAVRIFDPSGKQIFIQTPPAGSNNAHDEVPTYWPDRSIIRRAAAQHHDFTGYGALADHMEENGLPSYAQLMRAELANVLPSLQASEQERRIRRTKAEGVARVQKADDPSTPNDPAPSPVPAPAAPPLRAISSAGHGTQNWNPRPHPAAGNLADVIAARESDPLWQYHRLQLNYGGYPIVGPAGRALEDKPNTHQVVLPSQVQVSDPPMPGSMTHSRYGSTPPDHTANTPLGMVMYSAEQRAAEANNPDRILTERGGAGDDAHALGIGHPQNQPRYTALFGHGGGRRPWWNAVFPLQDLTFHSAPHDPYNLLASAVFTGNRHAILPLVDLLKRRDNPAGWSPVWSALAKRMTGDLPPEEVLRRAHAIAEATQPHSEDPDGHRHLMRGAYPDITGWRADTRNTNGSGQREVDVFGPSATPGTNGVWQGLRSGYRGTDDDLIRDFAGRNHDFTGYAALADHMEEHGLHPYAQLLRTELANVIPQLRPPPPSPKPPRGGKKAADVGEEYSPAFYGVDQAAPKSDYTAFYSDFVTKALPPKSPRASSGPVIASAPRTPTIPATAKPSTPMTFGMPTPEHGLPIEMHADVSAFPAGSLKKGQYSRFKKGPHPNFFGIEDAEQFIDAAKQQGLPGVPIIASIADLAKRGRYINPKTGAGMTDREWKDFSAGKVPKLATGVEKLDPHYYELHGGPSFGLDTGRRGNVGWASELGRGDPETGFARINGFQKLLNEHAGTMPLLLPLQANDHVVLGSHGPSVAVQEIRAYLRRNPSPTAEKKAMKWLNQSLEENGFGKVDSLEQFLSVMRGAAFRDRIKVLKKIFRTREYPQPMSADIDLPTRQDVIRRMIIHGRSGRPLGTPLAAVYIDPQRGLEPTGPESSHWHPAYAGTFPGINLGFTKPLHLNDFLPDLEKQVRETEGFKDRANIAHGVKYNYAYTAPRHFISPKALRRLAYS